MGSVWQPHGGPVTIQTVHVIQDDEFIPVTIQLAVQPKGGGATIDPTGPWADGRLDDLALLHTRASQQKQQIELTVGEGPHEPVELLVAGQENRALRAARCGCHTGSFSWTGAGSEGA